MATDDLTKRELETLQAVAECGFMYLAHERLGISKNTLTAYLMRISEKLGAVNTLQAVYYGMKRGIIK